MLPDVDKLNEALKKALTKIENVIDKQTQIIFTATYIFNDKEKYSETIDSLLETNKLLNEDSDDMLEFKTIELSDSLKIENAEITKIVLKFTKDNPKYVGWVAFQAEVDGYEKEENISEDGINILIKGTRKEPKEKENEFKGLYEEEKNKRLMLLADLENERKRLEKQRTDLFKMANMSAMKDLFEIVDDLNRALQNEADKDSLKMIYNKLLGILNNLGAVPVDIKENSEFDASKMEALTTIKVEDKKQDNKVIHIDQMGFIYKEDNSVIRNAKVIVGKFNA